MSGDSDDNPTNNSQSMSGEGQGEPTDNTGGDDDNGTGDSTQETTELSPAEARAVQNALDAQRKFIEGRFDRKSATKKLQAKLEEATKSGVEIQSVYGGKVECLTYNVAKNGHFGQALDLYNRKQQLRDAVYHEQDRAKKQVLQQQLEDAKQQFNNCVLGEFIGDYFDNDNRNEEPVNIGLQLGALLGRKLQVRNESRDMTYNRLNTGKLDGKRISHAGYGIENVFKQVLVTKHKNSVLHISLDASGSMGGDKWANTLTMTAAICKAATMCTNLRVQVSLRHTTSVGKGSVIPVVVHIYDSNYNKLHQLAAALKASRTPSMTPEGLCYEAMWKSNTFIPSTPDTDSYFLNISDGEPGGCHWGGGGYYHGEVARRHTRRYMDKLTNELGIQVISFFVNSHMEPGTKPSSTFVDMYGRNAACVQASDMTGIARALNDKFLSSKMTA
jgi:hypothetical protein